MPEMKVSVTQQQDSTTSSVALRQHRLLVDRPEAKGGLDAGPTGGELFLASVGACFMGNLIAAAKARGLVPKGASVEVIGEPAGSPARFQEIRMIVSGGGLERAELEKSVTIAERGCVVANTLKTCLALRVDLA